MSEVTNCVIALPSPPGLAQENPKPLPSQLQGRDCLLVRRKGRKKKHFVNSQTWKIRGFQFQMARGHLRSTKKLGNSLEKEVLEVISKSLVSIVAG